MPNNEYKLKKVFEASMKLSFKAAIASYPRKSIIKGTKHFKIEITLGNTGVNPKILSSAETITA